MIRDLRHALRSWLRTPSLYLLNVAVLAIGVGMAVALFSLVQTVLLRPLPYDQPDQLQVVWFRAPGLEIEQFDQSPGTYMHFLERARSFEQLGIYGTTEVALTGPHQPRRLLAAEITPSVLQALRITPALGRPLDQESGAPGAPPTALLSDALWRDQYGADPWVVGRVVRIDGIEREVVGVLPPSFAFPSPQVDLWLPLELDPSALQVTNFSFRGLGRLRPGVSAQAATAELTALTAALPRVYPDDLSERFLEQSGMEPFLVELEHEILGSVATLLWIALAAVGVVLAIAAANVANLLFVRADARANENALRTALGAGRLLLLRGAVAEGLAVGLPAGLAGAALASFALARLGGLPGFDLPRLWELDSGATTLLSAIGLGTGLGAALGALSRIGWRRPNAGAQGEALRGSRSSTASRGSWRARRGFVIAQVAASTSLLLGAGLLLRSFDELSRVDPGFGPEHLATIFLSLPEAAYSTPDRSISFWNRTNDQLEAQPGVQQASVVSKLPFDLGGHTGTLVDGHPSPDGLAYVFPHRLAGSHYFATAQIPLLAGRTFDDDDQKNEEVAVVSESLAHRFWRSPEAALGQRLRPAGTRSDGTDLPWATIVGVVGDLRNAGLREMSNPTAYFPLSPEGGARLRSLFVVVRSAPNAPFELDLARRTLATIDPNIPLARYRSGEELVASETARLRFTTMLLAGASATATAIGAFGLFAILLSFVGMRRREIGVRLALGATRTNVRWLVAATSLRLVGLGAGIGLLGSLLTSKALSSYLYGVSTLDPLTFAAVLGLLATLGLGAALLPASRAATVDPAGELRAE